MHERYILAAQARESKRCGGKSLLWAAYTRAPSRNRYCVLTRCGRTRLDFLGSRSRLRRFMARAPFAPRRLPVAGRCGWCLRRRSGLRSGCGLRNRCRLHDWCRLREWRNWCRLHRLYSGARFAAVIEACIGWRGLRGRYRPPRLYDRCGLCAGRADPPLRLEAAIGETPAVLGVVVPFAGPVRLRLRACVFLVHGRSPVIIVVDMAHPDMALAPVDAAEEEPR